MELSNQIIEVLEYLSSKIGLTVDWTSDNIIPYISQLYEKFTRWKTSECIYWIIIILIFAVVLSLFLKDIYITLDRFKIDIPKIVLFIAMIMISYEIYILIECQVFPEKLIYEYIQTYLKTH